MAKPIFCDKQGLWKTRLNEQLKTDKTITLLALGTVKEDVLAYLNKRTDLKIIARAYAMLIKRKIKK
jgi:hypothetical protein